MENGTDNYSKDKDREKNHTGIACRPFGAEICGRSFEETVEKKPVVADTVHWQRASLARPPFLFR